MLPKALCFKCFFNFSFFCKKTIGFHFFHFWQDLGQLAGQAAIIITISPPGRLAQILQNMKKVKQMFFLQKNEKS